MSSSCCSFALLFSILAASLFPSPVRAQGGMEGGGGDSYAAEFVAIGLRIAADLKGVPAHPSPEIDPDALAQALKTTRIETENDFLRAPDGTKLDAMNFPASRLIRLSRDAWNQTPSYSMRRRLVLHEYLGILQVDDTNYRVSAKWVAAQERDVVTSPDPGHWELVFDKSIDASTSSEITQTVGQYGEFIRVQNRPPSQTLFAIMASAASGETPKVTRLELRAQTYSWVGRTVCQSGDPRLTYRKAKWQVYWENATSLTELVAMGTLDPCLQ